MGGPGSGRPRYPTEKLKIAGTMETHRKKYKERAKEVQPGGVPEPPCDLPKYAKEFWDTRVKELIELNLARALDSESLYITAMLWDDYMRLRRATIAERSTLTFQNKQSKILQNLHRQLAKFGMTPTDRAGLIADADMRGSATKSYLA